MKGAPSAWAQAAVRALEDFEADRIVAEANQGGAMVEETLRTVDAMVPVTLVHATRGKAARAEPVAALYEQIKKGAQGALTQFIQKSLLLCNRHGCD